MKHARDVEFVISWAVVIFLMAALIAASAHYSRPCPVLHQADVLDDLIPFLPLLF